MSPRGSLTPVVASGTASVVKLLVATLAFTGAYVGVEASRTTSVPARASMAAGTTGAEKAQVETVVLSSKSMQDATAQAPAAGTVTVSPVTGAGSCDRPYRIQSVIDNPHPDRTVSYGWRLQRWSEGSRSWRTYLNGNSGFTGKSQTVEWQPHVVDNPGWYRATLSVSDGTSLRSAKFRVSC
ncbi:hypothetical protein AB0395_11785 [Streptosporangium sp. NPDC051023]|uniref:hypothetical protein n=1 Tax=Streptosporangium sp. NPDC051023 TaxID=3155410 RepID=UPI00344FCF0A